MFFYRVALGTLFNSSDMKNLFPCYDILDSPNIRWFRVWLADHQARVTSLLSFRCRWRHRF